ncbi:antitoxin family protein [Kovacikia minuta CCNUW1]|uniref:antitoxin family protein n=1 Tax=Kovacikia minuta TaxID=2931930 RepID=UPI001CC94FCF|nr:antitoxin family protein [Kovacikia minuta]UBF25827.1 antitoxin family protein [Kovacikia minuta CCNUW1]
MTESQTIEAIYEDGVLRPLQVLAGLAEHSKVRLTIEDEKSSPHPLSKFAGILSDEEAREMQVMISEEFGKIDPNGW